MPIVRMKTKERLKNDPLFQITDDCLYILCERFSIEQYDGWRSALRIMGKEVITPRTRFISPYDTFYATNESYSYVGAIEEILWI